MTVSSTSSRVVCDGNGSTTTFPFGFKVQQAADLTVVYTDATGTGFTLSASQYGATGFGIDAGGTVTYPLSGGPIASGTTLTIYRKVAVTQPTSISNQGAMWPQVIEAALDRLTYIAQGVADTSSRALVIAPTDGGSLAPLPTRTQRANAMLGFDASGQPYAATLSGGLTAASNWLIANFFPMSSAAAARGAIGAAGIADDNAFSGANSFPTPAAGDKSTRAPTTAFVQAAVAARTAVADANASPTDASRTIVFTSLTAARSVVLPAASGITAGRTIDLVDGSGSASAANAISLVPNGTDTVAGSNTTQVCINIPRGRCRLVCNGTNGWDVEIWSVIHTASLGGDVALNNTSNYIDGPSVAQGAVGTWDCMVSSTLLDTSGVATIHGKLWDGTNAGVASGTSTPAGTQSHVQTLFGTITNPAGNIRASYRGATSTASVVKFNYSGNSKDSTLRVRRIA